MNWFWYASPQTFYPLAGRMAPWFGMVAYWAIIFAGLGIIVTILRVTLESVMNGRTGFLIDLMLWLPLVIMIVVLMITVD